MILVDWRLLRAIERELNRAKSENRNDLIIYIRQSDFALIEDFLSRSMPMFYELASNADIKLFGYGVQFIEDDTQLHGYVVIVGQLSTQWCIGLDGSLNATVEEMGI